MPNDPAKQATYNHRGYINASRDLDTECDDRQGSLHQERDEERADDGRGLRRGVEHAQARVCVLPARAALCEEVVHELGATHAGVRVEEAEYGADEGDLKTYQDSAYMRLACWAYKDNLHDGVALYPCAVPDVAAPTEVELGEVSTVHTL